MAHASTAAQSSAKRGFILFCSFALCSSPASLVQSTSSHRRLHSCQFSSLCAPILHTVAGQPFDLLRPQFCRTRLLCCVCPLCQFCSASRFTPTDHHPPASPNPFMQHIFICALCLPVAHQIRAEPCYPSTVDFISTPLCFRFDTSFRSTPPIVRVAQISSVGSCLSSTHATTDLVEYPYHVAQVSSSPSSSH